MLTAPPRSRVVIHLEIAASVGTGVLFVGIVPLLSNKLFFIVPCMLGWLTSIAVRVKRDRLLLREWGVRLDNLWEASRAPLALGALSFLGIVLFRFFHGFLALPRAGYVMLVVYPAWGLLQQLFVQAFIARNLVDLGVRPAVTVLVSALLFGAVHAPDFQLAGLCGVAGLFWTRFYLTHGNVVPLALGHGWLGTFVYFWLLERDPLVP